MASTGGGAAKLGAMSIDIEQLEASRLALQAELDSRKPQTERNKLGQFATRPRLAREIVELGLALCSSGRAVSFLDPALGTGAFYSALLACAESQRWTQPRAIAAACGFEIDGRYAGPAELLWRQTPLRVLNRDFTREPVPSDGERATLLICNPPYVRHHHLCIAEKARLQRLSRQRAQMQLSGLAGLYCHFMAIAHGWMEADGVAGWLIPSEFMDVNYGRAVKEYLLRRVTLLRIHRFDPRDVQFDGALVSSAVVWFTNRRPPAAHAAQFSYGGTLKNPALSRSVSAGELEQADKWTRFPAASAVSKAVSKAPSGAASGAASKAPSARGAAREGYRLGDLFSIHRGLATGGNGFFILDEERVAALKLPRQFLRPVLPSARYIGEDVIEADACGLPLLDRRLFLIDCDLPEEALRRAAPALWSYLESGRAAVGSRYLCRFRRPWYSQERRPAAPIVCTYIGRSDHGGRPFRFLLNHSKATATNVYLMLYPRPLLARALASSSGAIRTVWRELNAIGRDTLLGSGRVYGGGMHKLEPRELASVPANDLARSAGLL